MSEVKKVTVTLAKPGSSRYPHGKVAYGFYKVVDGEVVLTDAAGNPAGTETGKKYRRKLKPGESETAVACILTRELRDAFRDASAPVAGLKPVRCPIKNLAGCRR